MKNTKKINLFLVVTLVLISSFVGYQIVHAATLTSTNVEPASLVAGTTNQVTVSFTTIGVIPPGGKVKVTFGAGFNVVGANGGTCSSFLGDTGFTTGVASQVVTITRIGGTATVAAHAETCTIDGIVNPVSAGSTGTYTITTTDASDVLIDNNTAVAADVITIEATANVSFALTTPADNGSTNHLTGGGATYSVNADVVSGTASVVITGTKTAGQTITVSDYGGGVDDLGNVTPGGTATNPTYTVNMTTPGDNVSLTGGNKTFVLTVSEAGKSDIVYSPVNIQVAVPTTIAAAGVTGFTAPVTGATPNVFGDLTPGAASYTVTDLTWSPVHDPFLAVTAYTATVELTSAAGYKFPVGNIAVPTADVGTVNSIGTTAGGNVSGNTLTYTVLFSATAPTPNAVTSGGRRHFGCNDPKALNYEYFSASDPSLCVYSKISTATPPVVTPKLPATGFPPRETNTFLDILVPFGILALISSFYITKRVK